MKKRNANTPYFPFLDKLDIDQDVKSRLSINLSGIYSGNDNVLITPIAKVKSPEFILSEWSKVFNGNRDRMNDILIEIEESQQSKTGPRSKSLPWSERWEQTVKYFEDTTVDYSALDAFPDAPRDKGCLRPLSIAQAIKFLKNGTNSGLPHYTRKGKVKDRLVSKFEYYLSRKDPCVLFTRTQEMLKTRDVWGYPMADTLNEMMFYKPVLDYQKKLHWRAALKGPKEVDHRLTHIINEAKMRGLELISVDFSNYDRSLKRDLQFKIFEYYKYLFQSSYSSRLHDICDRKSSIGLVTPDGIMQGFHGEPSGSTFTNEDDSIGQYIISRDSGALEDDLFNIQGDDGVYAIQPDKVVSLYSNFKRYGIDINEDKSSRSSDYLIYLQNLYHIDYQKKGVIGGVYPTFRALNRILYQERWSNFEDYDILGSDYYSIRAISILENCKHHPLFENLVRFVLKYDKFGLRPTQKGIRQYVNMLSDSSGIEGIIQNQYGDDVKGMNSFETVKLIKRIDKA